MGGLCSLCQCHSFPGRPSLPSPEALPSLRGQGSLRVALAWVSGPGHGVQLWMEERPGRTLVTGMGLDEEMAALAWRARGGLSDEPKLRSEMQANLEQHAVEILSCEPS